MRCKYLIYLFGVYHQEHMLPPRQRCDSGADYEVDTFAGVIELLSQCEGVKVNIDVDCIVNGEFVATLRRGWGELWQYLDADSGHTWTAEEWAKDMGASL